MTKYEVAQVKKAIVCAVAFAAELVNEGLVHGEAAVIIRCAISALGVVGVFAVKNKPLKK